MTPEERELLTKSITLAEENNKILRGIRRGNRWSTAWKITYWLVIIAISYGAYVYMEPYIIKFKTMYDKVQTDIDSIKTTTSKIPAVLKP